MHKVAKWRWIAASFLIFVMSAVALFAYGWYANGKQPKIIHAGNPCLGIKGVERCVNANLSATGTAATVNNCIWIKERQNYLCNGVGADAYGTPVCFDVTVKLVMQNRIPAIVNVAPRNSC